MSGRVTRKESPPEMTGRTGYRACKEHLRRDFENRCAYCCIHEDEAGGDEHFWIDHLKPVSKHGPVNEYDNLYWACMGCNRHKGASWPDATMSALGYRFVDPCIEQDYGAHFYEDVDGTLHPLTRPGTYHLDKLNLNRRSRKKRRRERSEFLAALQVAIELAAKKRNEAAAKDEIAGLEFIVRCMQDKATNLMPARIVVIGDEP